MNLPTLTTKRLTLRPMTPADAPRLHELVSAREVAYNTLTIPHPYPEGAAAEWIALHASQAESGDAIHLAIDDGQLCGVIGLMIRKESDAAEVGYWIGVPYWGRGYASEALAEILRYGFETLKLNRIYAGYFSRNAASGRVLTKNGMRYEGTLRQHIKKWDEYVDVVYHGALREEWKA